LFLVELIDAVNLYLIGLCSCTSSFEY